LSMKIPNFRKAVRHGPSTIKTIGIIDIATIKGKEYLFYITPARLSLSQSVKGEESDFPPPRKDLGIVDSREGLREGDKMAISFKSQIGPNEKY